MSYYDDASLVLIPSGVKAAKVYSQKPTNGTGDLTFSRASTATRTNSAGLVESGRTNFIRNSSMVGAATPNTIPTNWTASTLTGLTREVVGVGTESGFPYVDIRYFGTPTSTGFFGIQFETNTQIAASIGQAWAYSFYFKKIAGTVPTAGFQLTEYNSSGTFLAISNVAVALNTATTLTRFSGTRILTQATTAFTNTFLRLDVTAAVAYDFTMRFYAPQIELGSVATAWIPTTTSAASVGIGINVPRLDYSGGATCPRLLLEPQRTNLFLRSEEFDNASWVKFGSTITANATTSPDGMVDADLYTTTSTSDFLQQSLNVTSGVAYTISAFVKNGDANLVDLIFTGAGYPSAASIQFNLTTQTANVTSGTATASIQDYGNGWYRIVGTSTAGATASMNIRFSSASLNTISTFYIWGAQLEVGSFVSTYIPTTTATVTRLVDIAEKFGIGSLIGSPAGTIFLQVQILSLGYARSFISLQDTSFATNSIRIETTAANRFRIQIRNASTTILDQTVTTGSAFTTGNYKLAYAYDTNTNGVAFYVNGVSLFTTTVASIPTACVNLFLGTRLAGIYDLNVSDSFDQALLFKTRLTNDQLEVLTSEGYPTYALLAQSLNCVLQ